jgi:hypothetical protein
MSPSKAAHLLLQRLETVDASFSLYGSGESGVKVFDDLAEAARIARKYNWRAELLKEKGKGRRHA